MKGQAEQFRISVSLGFSIPTGVPTDILAKPMGRFLMQGMTLTHGYLASPGVAPIDTGRLRSSLQPGSGTTGIDPSPVPLWFKVGTNVEYAAPLDSPEKLDPRYRSGPSMGSPTKGWLSDSPKHVAAQIEALYPRLAADIEAAFAGRG